MKYKIENLIDSLKLEREAEVRLLNLEMERIGTNIICKNFSDMQIRTQLALYYDAKIKAIDSVLETVERWVREETYGAGDED